MGPRRSTTKSRPVPSPALVTWVGASTGMPRDAIRPSTIENVAASRPSALGDEQGDEQPAEEDAGPAERSRVAGTGRHAGCQAPDAARSVVGNALAIDGTTGGHHRHRRTTVPPDDGTPQSGGGSSRSERALVVGAARARAGGRAGEQSRFRSRIDCGVTSTSSSAAMNSIADLEGERPRRRQPERLVVGVGPDVGELLLLGRVDVHVARPAVLADDHALVDLDAGADEQLGPLLEVEQAVGVATSRRGR